MVVPGLIGLVNVATDTEWQKWQKWTGYISPHGRGGAVLRGHNTPFNFVLRRTLQVLKPSNAVGRSWWTKPGR